MAQALSTKRYATAVGGNANDFDHPSSEVYYAPAFRDAGAQDRRAARALGDHRRAGPAARGNEVVVVTGADWTGKLRRPAASQGGGRLDGQHDEPGRDHARDPPEVPGLKVMVPMKVARGSSVEIVRGVQDRHRQGPAAGGQDRLDLRRRGAPVLGISMTTMRNPPILEGETGHEQLGRPRVPTYYDGKNLQRLAFQKGGMTYWISNTLKNDLSAKTIEEIAKSLRPLNRAKLAEGPHGHAISVETAGSTP